MAPELYEEEYDELVDVYSFGMCVLEMLTSEYPYSECSNPAQIYKKVTSGKLPEAFFRIQDVEAQRFVEKCLETAAKRPSAQELLADPFLASDEGESLPIVTRTQCQTSSTPTGTLADMPVLSPNLKRSTEMTITRTVDPEEETIFLKVKITDKDGQARNVYFPFDILSDTPIDVAMEMVKELEITDWEPSEIAEMIDEEVSALPSWQEEGECDSPLNHYNQHSFNYDEEDDDDDNDNNRIHHPFYSLSSHSSSHASLPGLYTSPKAQFHRPSHTMTSTHDWVHEGFLMDDDATSQSSMSSYKFSNLNYCSGNENDFHSSPKTGDSNFSARHNCTRFCPNESRSKNYNYQRDALFNTERDYGSNDNRQKMNRIKSMVDIRSQLLQRSLEEKRRLFKTVGAVENIGYKDPGEFCGHLSMYGEFPRRSAGNYEGQGFGW